jgi:hypothetical protein
MSDLLRIVLVEEVSGLPETFPRFENVGGAWVAGE